MSSIFNCSFIHLVLCIHGFCYLDLFWLSAKFHSRLFAFSVSCPVSCQAAIETIAFLLLGLVVLSLSIGKCSTAVTTVTTNLCKLRTSFFHSDKGFGCCFNRVFYLSKGIWVYPQLSSIVKFSSKGFSLTFQNLFKILATRIIISIRFILRVISNLRVFSLRNHHMLLTRCKLPKRLHRSLGRRR